MIECYPSGQALLDANGALLDTNPYQTVFFRVDAPLLACSDHVNYALRCVDGDEVLLALRVEPYSLLLFGSAACAAELTDFLIREGYILDRFLCNVEVGAAMMDAMARHGRRYTEALAMDFMEATAVTAPTAPAVEVAVDSDLDEICECLVLFGIECHLLEPVNRDAVARRLPHFRVLRQGGRIAAMASMSDGTAGDMRIGCVYTREDCRGQGLARQVVNAVKNDILAGGKVATLNVDRRNPVTNHLYRALGFRPLFSHGEYRPAD